MTPIFDANAHPVLSVGDKSETFADLIGALKEVGFFGAAAVGLPGKDGFEPTAYIKACRLHSLYPVAGWPNIQSEQIERQIAQFVRWGYPAIKIHPRNSGLSVRDKRDRKSTRLNSS